MLLLFSEKLGSFSGEIGDDGEPSLFVIPVDASVADEDGEENSAHRREVDLGLEGEDGEAQRDGGTGSHGLHHLIDVVSSRDRPQHEPLSQGEEAQEDEVVRRLPSHSCNIEIYLLFHENI